MTVVSPLGLNKDDVLIKTMYKLPQLEICGIKLRGQNMILPLPRYL